MINKKRIFQHPYEKEDSICTWHRDYKKDGKMFNPLEIFPDGMCPYLYHSLYPYFLAFHYGAKFSYNEQGDSNVCCPAKLSVETIVRKRDNDGTYDERIAPDRIHVIFADVTKVTGECPYGHVVGDRIIFPTSMMSYFMCPAGVNNIFPFLDLEIPGCIDIEFLRCPDFAEDIYYDITKE